VWSISSLGVSLQVDASTSAVSLSVIFMCDPACTMIIGSARFRPDLVGLCAELTIMVLTSGCVGQMRP